MKNTSGPIVSVIIPAYNASQYIRECIESVLCQTHKNVECIVVDDGSKDDTADIVKSFEPKVIYVHQENAERSAARNKGLRYARGEFITFLDADDYIAPEKVSEQMKYFSQHPEAGVVYSDVLFFKESGNRQFSSPRRVRPSGDILHQLLYGNFITMHSPLIRRSVIDEAGGFNPSLSHNEDWEFLLRLSLAGALFYHMTANHAFCRLHSGNTSGDILRMYRAKLEVAEMFISNHADRLRAVGVDCAKVTAFHKADCGKALVLAGAVQEGRALIAQGCREPIPGRMAFRLVSLAAVLIGPEAIARMERLTHGIRKWRRTS